MRLIISNFIDTLTLVIGLFLFGKVVLEEKVKVKYSNRKLILIIILFTLIYALILLIYTGTAKTILMTLLNMLLFQTIFDISIKKSLLITIVCMILLIIIELAELIFLTEVLNISRDFCYNSYAGSLISNAIIFMSFILISYKLRYWLRNLINEKIEDNKKLIILSIMTAICILLFFYEIVKEIKLSNNILMYLSAIIILLFSLFNLVKKTIENNKLMKEYDNLLMIMSTYEKEIEKQRILRHETKNEFRTIRAKLNDNQSNNEIIDYIDEILNEKIEIKQEKYAKFGYLPSNGIKGLCYYKVEEAEARGITISVNISKRIVKTSIYKLNIKEQRDFGRILGVLLDNAIEACIISKEKILGIEAYVTKSQEFQMIISNSYNNLIDSSKIGKKVFSTKGKNRGHGLLLVNKLIKDNSIFDINTNIKDNIYIKTITIKK